MADVRKGYSKEDDKVAIIAEMEGLGYTVKEYQTYKDGQFLIFTDVPVVKTLSERVDDLEARVARLEGA